MAFFKRRIYLNVKGKKNHKAPQKHMLKQVSKPNEENSHLLNLNKLIVTSV